MNSAMNRFLLYEIFLADEIKKMYNAIKEGKTSNGYAIRDYFLNNAFVWRIRALFFLRLL